MGATNPSKFDLDLFVNNLKAPGASTFETVGQLHYNQAGVISLVCRPEIATDGLVLRGQYSTITLAVYGVLSDQVLTNHLIVLTNHNLCPDTRAACQARGSPGPG